ncbi:uncharacterized protein LOC133737149 [Rosa rugosa]|uniref:uncharacterized protein LOC133737149 n=1 Tax=Rosa rugosa TaxID=74645 RepID=UPI002B4064C2|nr:uncharacterized protein LOC133737149 [Rosa rugosa]
MDKTWVKLNRCSTEYLVGMHNFVQHSLRVAGRDGLIKCPCRLCCNRDSFSPATVKEHLKVDGMDPVYEDMLWVDHGEALPEPVFVDEMEQEYEVQDEPLDMLHMLTDVFATNSPCHSPYVGEDGSHTNVRPSDAERFYNLIEEANISLYPDGETLPCSLYQTKKLITGLGLTYQKIDACPNDCILYWKDTANLEYCPSCGESRYLVDTIDDNNQTRKVSAKILRYFPIIPRLQRLYMSRVTSKFMSWHGTERPKDGLMRHPADSPAWKELDRLHPSFARDMRNVRLGLASDGFNPFGQMSLSHSTWPVVIAIYNLPPWLCMKKPYMLLSLIIPGPKAPGNDIDVYLAPLIDELKSLWEVGIETYDVHAKESFTMRAALLWTINDFPAYANLSGWSTKGYKACPNCGDDSSSFRLKHSQKICYMGHRRFLPINHRWRTQRRPFNGKEEHRTAPIPLSVHESLIQLSSLQFKFGKGTNVRSARKKKGTPAAYSGQWKKKSIFYQLPYWKDLLLRHNLDVMHIEKNVCESIVGTLLGIDGKNKDTIKARADLEELNIWPNLHPERRGPLMATPLIYLIVCK